ncbi:MAG: hypothetical protein KGP14_10070 [Betaproteobacteria bacterium]|nr:hypothetical protein [Betaproteobacteria bacterium]
MDRYLSDLEAIQRRAKANPMLGFDEAAEQMALTNIFHLCPQLTWPQMQQTARAAAFNQSQAVLDLHHATTLLNDIEVIDPASTQTAEQPFIYAAPHYGSYRLIPAYLLVNNRPLTIVIDDLVAEAQGTDFERMFKTYADQAGAARDLLTFRYTSQSSLLVGMIRDIRKGRSLLLYFDGNKSTAAGSDHTVPVDFLGHKVHARYGIPQVAQMTRTAIVPVTATRGKSPAENTIAFEPPIAPDHQLETFNGQAMQRLWSGLAEKVAINPAHWEALRYVHKFADYTPPSRQTIAGSAALVFDHRRFAIKCQGNRGEIYDRSRLTVTAVKGTVLDALTRLGRAEPGTDPASMVDSPDLRAWLVQKEFLVERARL